MTTQVIVPLITVLIAAVIVVAALVVRKMSKNEYVDAITAEVIDKFKPIVEEELPKVLSNAGIELDYATYRNKIVEIIGEIINSKDEAFNIGTSIKLAEDILELIGDEQIIAAYTKLVDAKAKEIEAKEEIAAKENEEIENAEPVEEEPIVEVKEEEPEIHFDEEQIDKDTTEVIEE